MNPFEDLIDKVGKLLGVSLHAQKGYLCRISVEGSLKVQIEHESKTARILLASFLCDLPPGRYREEVLREALKNNSSLSRLGVLSYSSKNNHLTYFLYLSDSCDEQRLSSVLLEFIELAKKWKSAVETGQLSLISQLR